MLRWATWCRLAKGGLSEAEHRMEKTKALVARGRVRMDVLRVRR